MLTRKILISLLLATVAFASFAVAAYSGLFDVIDTRLYDQRVRSHAAARLDSAVTEIEQYRNEITQSLAELVDRRSIRTVFRVNQSLTDIRDRQAALAAFAELHPDFDFVRFIDNARSQLWFSSLAADIAVQQADQITYQPVELLQPPLDLPAADQEGLRWFGPRDAFQISVQVLETNDAPQGLALAWFRLSGFTRRLVDEGWIGPSEQVQLAGDGTLIVNARRHFTTADRDAIVQALARDGDAASLRSELGQEFALVRHEPEQGLPAVVLLVSSERLRMEPALRAILLAGSFVVTFLLAFLILNLRQDPAIVVAERFRRFQQAVVRDLLATEGAVDPELWRRELDARREKIEAQLKRGIGRLRGDRKTEVERRIARSWSEMYRVLGGGERAQTTQLEAVSLNQIQAIIEQTISRYGPNLAAQVAGAAARSGAPDTPPHSHRAEAEALEPVDVEPADAEELEAADAEELEPADLEPADAEELETADLEPADVEPADAEELEPADLEPADTEALEPVDAEPADAEELETADLEPVDAELADADELETADLEPAEAEALEPVDVEPADAEELEPADLEPADVEALEPVDVEPADVEALEPVDAEPADAEELEAADLEPADVEALEPVDAEPADAEELEPADLEPADAEELETADLEPADAEELEPADLEPADVEALEPADSEPADAEELADLEPADTEALEPVDVEPADTEELADLEPADVEALEPVDAEPADAEELEAADLEPAEHWQDLSRGPFGEDVATIFPDVSDTFERIEGEDTASEPSELPTPRQTTRPAAQTAAPQLDSATAQHEAPVELERVLDAVTPASPAVQLSSESVADPALEEPAAELPVFEEPEYDATAPSDVEPLDRESIRQSYLAGVGEFGLIPFAGSQEIQANARISFRPIKKSFYSVHGLTNGEAFQLVDVDDFSALLGRNSKVIEERSGLPYIDATAFVRKSPRIDLQTQTLADQIIAHRNEASIDEVLKPQFGDLDLDDVLDKSKGKNLPDVEAPPGSLAIGYGGFDFGVAATDGTEHEVYRRLVRLTRRWDARSACILDRQPDAGWLAQFTIGMPQRCPGVLQLGPTTEFVQNVFDLRRVLLLKRPLSMFRDFDGDCHAEHLEFIQSWLLMPLEHRSGRYLMVGFVRAFEDLVDVATRTQIVAEVV